MNVNDNVVFGSEFSKQLGIFLSDCKDINVIYNRCNRNFDGIINPFIKISNCNNVNVKNNTVNDTKSSFDHFGIHIQNTSNALICSNQLIKVGNGIVASGMNPNLQIVQNSIYDTYRGLLYQNGTISNIINDHRVNFFIGPNSLWHSIHEGNTYKFNKYLVRNDQDYPIFGASPFFKPATVSPGNQQWFVYPPDGQAKPCILSLGSGRRFFDPYTDITVLNELTEGQRWDGLTDFYLYSRDHTDESNNSTSLQNLYQSLLNSNLAKFADISFLIQKYHNIPIALTSALDSKQQEIASIQEQLSQNNLSFETTALSEDNTGPFDVKEALILILENKYLELENILSQIQALRSSRVITINQLNNAVAPESIYETDLKFLINMWIKKAQEIIPTSAELIQIKSLAERCLHTIGDQVMFAQFLLPMDMQFDRISDMFCSPAPLAHSRDNVLKSAIVQDNYNRYSIETKATSYEMYDLNGGRVHSGKIQSNSLNIDLSSYHNGIYIIKLKDEQTTEILKLGKY